MIAIAVVEDDDNDAKKIIGYLSDYSALKNEKFLIDRYCDALSFLEKKSTYDLIFMDIMMPSITGMDAAKKFRQNDKDTLLIFITNMTSFAIKSYEVDALDYILKPISYQRVVFKLGKALDIIKSRESKQLSSEWRVILLESVPIRFIMSRCAGINFAMLRPKKSFLKISL